MLWRHIWRIETQYTVEKHILIEMVICISGKAKKQEEEIVKGFEC